MVLTFPLPADTRKIFNNNNPRCSNLSLLLDRYLGYNGQWKLDEKDKAELFKKLKNYFSSQNNYSQLITANYSRQQAMTKAYSYSSSFTAKPEWRLVVGLGQTSVLETSMTLDRVTGIPLIPGSALKGLTAAYALLNVLEESDRDRLESLESLTEKQRLFIDIFGTQTQSGKVIFFDAVPTKVPIIEPDIMNNHYSDYYSGKASTPTPDQSPIPVYFLTLGNKSEFALAVGGNNQELVNQASTWLKKGLSTLGIGAKTAAGYGYLI
jgi:CRISPR-associated protein Cmr6